MTRLVLIGAPGAGKGTQGELLAQRWGLSHIATGDLLRAEVQAGSGLGQEVGGYLDTGTLVPDQVLLDLVLPLVHRAATGAGYLLDGFPRSVDQARRLDELAGAEAAVQRVLFLDVPRPELVARLLHRAAEQDRSDDTEEVIVRRLRVFDELTAPLIGYYRDAGLLSIIDASGSVQQVLAATLAAL
ncbi:MAG: adenylate kinase [Jatrophihabitans sp.]